MLILEEVFKNGPDDIQERMNVIANSFDALLQLQTDVQAQGNWCSGCGRWYYKKDCNTKFFEEEIIREISDDSICKGTAILWAKESLFLISFTVTPI